MNILTKEESDTDQIEKEWEKDQCFNIEFEKSKDLVRTWKKDQDGEIIGPGKFYFKLKFKYTFTQTKQ